MKKLLLTLGIALSVWGGDLWAITLTWSYDNKLATLTKETGQVGELATWLSNPENVAAIEKANTLRLAEGIKFNNDDIAAINKLKGIKHLDIDAHQGDSNQPIDNPNFESIDFTDMNANWKPSIAQNSVKCNPKQVIAYPYPIQVQGVDVDKLYVECNAGTGNGGFIASQEEFFKMVYGKTNISKIIVKGEINQTDINAIKQAQAEIIDMDSVSISKDEFDFSGNTSVKYILCPSIWAKSDSTINTKAFKDCTNLLAASAAYNYNETSNPAKDSLRVLGYCNKPGNLGGVLNSSNYSHIGGWGNSNVKVAVLAGNLNHSDLDLFNSLRELNLAQAIISNDDLYCDNNGKWGNLEKVTLPTDTSYTKIKDQAFTYASNLREITFSKNLKEIGASAFENCSKLPSFIDLVNTSIKTIGEGAFKNCKQIQYIRFPESLDSIEAYAFQLHDCEVLRIPRNVKYIGTQAFQSSAGTEASGSSDHVEQLKDVYFQGKKAPKVEKDAFGNGAYTGYGGYNGPSTGDEYATRANYINGNKWFAVLHYRPDLTAEEEAQYVDTTRNYFFKDLYLGDQRRWPTKIEFDQAFGTDCVNRKAAIDTESKKPYSAGTFGITNGKHFDGTDLTEDEKTRIGLYQFVLTRNDAPIPDLNEPDKPDFPLNISDDDWWTICLPFSLDSTQVKKIFGDQTQLYTLSEVKRDQASKKIQLFFNKDVMNGDDGGAEIFGKKLYEGYKNTGIKAWYPYVIKPSKDFGGKTAVVENYRLEAGSEKDVVIKADDEYNTDNEENKEKGIGWYYVFRGNCSGIVGDQGVATQSIIYFPDNCYFMGQYGGKAAFLYQSKPDMPRVFSPYTCAIMAYMYDGKAQEERQVYHFIDDSFIDASTGAKLHDPSVIDDSNNTPTSVENVEIVTPDQIAKGNVYNLNGQLVKENATSLEGLSKGVYIMNGKKYIVK